MRKTVYSSHTASLCLPLAVSASGCVAPSLHPLQVPPILRSDGNSDGSPFSITVADKREESWPVTAAGSGAAASFGVTTHLNIELTFACLYPT